MFRMILRLSASEIWILINLLFSVTGELSIREIKLGEPVTLYCDGKATSDEFEITWKTLHQLVAKFSKGQLTYGPGFENRVHFENVDKRGGFSLHINPTVFSDTDIYICSSGTDLIKTWNLVVTVSTPKQVEVIERGTVTLPCYRIIDRQLPMDKLDIQWRKNGKVVLNLIKGTTHHYPDLDYRANIFLHEIRKGDLSLVIKDIEMTDEGNYECFSENDKENILSSVKVHVIKGIYHGHRQRVLRYTGESFTFFVSNKVEIYLRTERTHDEKLICKIGETGATCQAHVRERIALRQGYLTLNDLTKNDEGTYKLLYIKDNSKKEIVLEMRQLPGKDIFGTLTTVVTFCLVGVFCAYFLRRTLQAIYGCNKK